MSDCIIEREDGSRADIRTGDIVTSNGGMLGLGHAGIIEVRGKRLIVIEVMLAADGSVHVQERDLCDFLDDYDAQNRDVFISRPRQPAGESDRDWAARLQRVVDYTKERVCTRYPVWSFALDVLFHLPAVWYCSDLVREAFRREGIELKLTLAPWNASDDAETRSYMFAMRGEAIRRFGTVQGERYLRGFTLPDRLALPPDEARAAPPLTADTLEGIVANQLWRRELEAMAALIDAEFERAAREVDRG
jgi:hypothetical protein